MRAIVLQRPHEPELRELEDPVAGPGEVLVRVSGAGLCGTDVHIHDGEFPPTTYPIVPGHEFAGHVEMLGAGVEHLDRDQPIVADCTLSCGMCRACRSGRYNLCTDWGAIGDTVDGAFAEFVRVPARQVYAWPPHIPHEVAPLTEPLACALHGVDRLGSCLGARTLVVGAGVIGSLAGALLARAGAVVDACEPHDGRRERARNWAAHRVASLDEVAGTYDVVVDATGVPVAIQQAIGVLAPGGRFLLLGVAPPNAEVPIRPYDVFKHEVTLLGSMSKRYDFVAALDLIAQEAIDLAPLLEASLPLGEYPRAIERVRRGEGLKQVLDPRLC